MAIVLNSTPATYSSAQGDLIFTAYEATKANDPVTYPNYKYVCDVYIGGNLIYRAKTFPNPVNQRGIFNIGTIVRDYLAMTFSPSADIRSQEFGSGNFFIDVQCKFGEEYNGTTYTNLTVDSSRKYFNHYNGQITSLTTILGGYLDLPATNRPYESSVVLNSSHTFIPYFPSSTTAIPVQIKTYDVSNALVSTQNTTVTPTVAFNLQQLNLSPTIINTLFPGLISGTTKYYTVQIGSTTYKFNVICEAIYTPYTIHFLNQLGGFESFLFAKSSKKSYDIEKKNFTQLAYRVDGSGVVTYLNASNVVHETKTTYASLFTPKLRLTTDLLTNVEWSWLKELVFSPLVYFQDNTLFKPVSIGMSNYEERTFINNKLTSLVIDLDLGVQLNAQYR